MISKAHEKIKAIGLRKQGLSYREILSSVPVAKSTLSLWLRNVGLSKHQRQRLTKRKLDAARRGGMAKHEQRIALTEKIYKKAKLDIPAISKKELWLMGIMLYWAEGSKEKAYRPGSGVQFTNSDAWMVRLFIKWLTEVCAIDRSSIVIEIYIHENSKNSLPRTVRHWSEVTEFPKTHFTRIYFKRNTVSTSRKNTDDSYFGLVKVRVRASSILNRKIVGWIRGIAEHCGVV